MDTDVIIVGAGPTGLVLANELQRRKVRYALLEKSLIPSDKSRALVVQPRTMELFHLMGIAQPFVDEGFPADGARIFVRGKEKAHNFFGSLNVPACQYHYLNIISQANTEAILSRSLLKQGGEILRGWEVQSFQMKDHSIEAEVTDSDGNKKLIRSQYIVGCDGAHSVVRHQLGIEFEGDAYQQNFLLADVRIDFPFSYNTFNLFLGKTGTCAFFPFKEERMGRLLVVDFKQSGKQTYTLEDIEENAKFYIGPHVKLSNPQWISHFRLHHRVAKTYQRGRAFLAGDAAHIHSPAGGQGMNTGIQDAYNLAWKLALTIKNGGARNLLESYNEERRPVGIHLLKRTDRLFTFAASRSRIITAIRNTLVSMLARTFMASEKNRRAMFDFVAQLGIRYSQSILNGQSVSSTEKRFLEILPPGFRVPDAKLADGSSLYDALKTAPYFHFLLLGESDAAKSADWLVKAQSQVAPYNELVTCHALPPSADLVALFGADRPCSYIVRPDGYVLFRTLGPDLSAAISHFDETVFRPASGRK